MGDHRSSNATTSCRLPPGSGFYPSEKQLVCYYLASKNSDIPRYGTDVIKEIDLYNFDPFDLPETACFRFGKGGRRKHWYCYVGRVDVERRRRAAGNGYWKRRDRGRGVVCTGAGRVVVGTRNRFVFYLSSGNRAAGRRTEWVMYEYALIGHPKASFVLCRVLVESDHRNNISDCESTLCCEQSNAKVRGIGVQPASVAMRHHIGVQHDGAVTAEPKLREDSAVDNKDEILKFAPGQASAIEDGNIGDPVAQQMKPFKDLALVAMTIGGLSTEQLTAILEEDFIELDDLACPSQGID